MECENDSKMISFFLSLQNVASRWVGCRRMQLIFQRNGGQLTENDVFLGMIQNVMKREMSEGYLNTVLDNTCSSLFFW